MNIVERQFCVLHFKHTLNLIITMTGGAMRQMNVMVCLNCTGVLVFDNRVADSTDACCILYVDLSLFLMTVFVIFYSVIRKTVIVI